MARIKKFENFVNEKYNTKFDITKDKKSVAGRLEDFIGKMGGLEFEDIKAGFLAILNDEDGTHASDAVRNKWKDVISKSRNKVMLMHAITNLYLKAAQLGLDK